MKTTYLISFILFTFILFSQKSHSIDVVVANSPTISDVTIGQLQHFDISTVQHIRFYPDEFLPFSEHIIYNNDFLFYGQPGSNPIRGSSLGGDLSSYSMLMSQVINGSNYYRDIYRNWFLNFPSEPYPSELEEEEDEIDDDPTFDDENSEVLQRTIITIAMTAFSIFGFTTGMTYRFDS
jgi:hypothetical protein